MNRKMVDVYVLEDVTGVLTLLRHIDGNSKKSYAKLNIAEDFIAVYENTLNDPKLISVFHYSYVNQDCDMIVVDTTRQAYGAQEFLNLLLYVCRNALNGSFKIVQYTIFDRFAPTNSTYELHISTNTNIELDSFLSCDVEGDL